MKKFVLPMLVSALLLFSACQATPGDNADDVPSPFAASEIESFFTMTEEQMEDLFGKPTHEIIEENGLRTAQYKDAEILYGDGYIARIKVRGGEDLLVRGIKIGDNLSDVKNQFPNEGNEPSDPVEETAENDVVLYGEYVHMSPYGVLHRVGDRAQSIEVADSDMTALFEFTDDRVSTITYSLAA